MYYKPLIIKRIYVLDSDYMIKTSELAKYPTSFQYLLYKTIFMSQ